MKLSKQLMVEPGKKIKLNQRDPDGTGRFKSKKAGHAAMRKNHQRLGELQSVLYAENKRSVLIVLQAMDAGGKDGTIKHVMGPLNPQSCKVRSFKAPTDEELSHDFLWRIHKQTPRKGEIVIFNRSHYEDVLIARVHNLVDKKVWSKRYAQINDFEKLLSENNIHILKFFLHISKDEQLARLQARIDEPAKNWKINPQDFEERKYWADYVRAYEDALSRCSTSYAPWFVIPANKKWFRNYAVSQIVADALSAMKMAYPKPDVDVSTLREMS
ncbi:MAG: polyphosphate kinase 2 family protein [Sedimentisphaerales bacterium]|nr:polyphosphate kinase 2 family protein [Sedimentisphaerales bacterium]